MKNNTTLLASRRASAISDTIEVGRRLDLSVARRLGRAVSRLVESGLRACTIDMSAVESADSGGFGALVSALRKLEEAGTYAVIVCSNPAIRKLFEVTSVSRMAPIVARPQEARALHAAFTTGLAS